MRLAAVAAQLQMIMKIKFNIGQKIMTINTKPIDKKIRILNRIINDATEEPKMRLMAISKKARLLQEKADLIKSTVSDINEITF